jgi:hypothetical protein
VQKECDGGLAAEKESVLFLSFANRFFRIEKTGRNLGFQAVIRALEGVK